MTAPLLGLSVLLEHCFYLFFKDALSCCAYLGVENFSVFDKYYGRDAAHSKLCCEAFFGINVALADVHTSGIFLRKLVDDGGDAAAWSAPGSKEVDDYGFSAREELREIFFCDFHFFLFLGLLFLFELIFQMFVVSDVLYEI